MPTMPSIVTNAADQYLRRLPLEARRLGGVVYTPPHLVRLVLAQAGYHARATHLQGLSLLDPACGGGAFLVGAVDALADDLTAAGIDLTGNKGRTRLFRLVEDRLFGIDVDPAAVELSRQAVVAAVTARSAAPPAGFFAHNVAEADFLLHALPSGVPEQVDRVVGNPPYVATTRLRPEQKETLRRRFETASGRLDLYTLFMERTAGLLRDGGRFAFITPDKFLTSASAKPLRAFLSSRGQVSSVARFRSHKVFADAATVPCVTVFEKGARSGAVRVLELDHRPDASGQLPVLSRRTVRRRLNGEPWNLSSDPLQALVARLQQGHRPLGVYATRISVGIATGRDRLLVLPANRAAQIEPELRRPAVRGRDLLPFQIQDPGLEILVPYTVDEAHTPRLVELSDYPGAREYLSAHREELQRRHCVRTWQKRWYDLHDPVRFDLAAQPKILVPDVANSNRFVFDPGRYCPLHSAYYLLPKDIDPVFLTAVLNSAPLELLVRRTAPVVKDGFSRYRRQFLISLPIPQATRPEQRTIVHAAEQGCIQEIDDRVAALFRLSPGERKQVAGFVHR